MSFKNIRFPIIIVALALTLGFLFGARWLYENQSLARPLEEALRAVRGVSDVALKDESAGLLVKVRVGDVPQLETLVSDIWQAVDSVGPSGNVNLELTDSRTQALQDVYYNFHFFLQEAMATGRYSELPARLKEVASAGGVDRYRVFVAPDYVYLQLHQGDANLYEIIPRQAEPAPEPDGALAARSVSVRPW